MCSLNNICRPIYVFLWGLLVWGSLDRNLTHDEGFTETRCFSPEVWPLTLRSEDVPKWTPYIFHGAVLVTTISIFSSSAFMLTDSSLSKLSSLVLTVWCGWTLRNAMQVGISFKRLGLIQQSDSDKSYEWLQMSFQSSVSKSSNHWRAESLNALTALYECSLCITAFTLNDMLVPLSLKVPPVTEHCHTCSGWWGTGEEKT